MGSIDDGDLVWFSGKIDKKSGHIIYAKTGYIDFRLSGDIIPLVLILDMFENCCSSSGSGKFTIADEDDYSDMPDHRGFRRRRKGRKWAKAYHIP